jgi:glycosyltransferase involved in cell wall biosynthesis
MNQKILIMTFSLVKFDAIGNDLRLEAECLRSLGYEVFIYAPQTDHDNSKIIVSRDTAEMLMADITCLVILHHSCYLPDLDHYLSILTGPCILRYHNITPAEFFPHNKHIQRDLVQGRQQSVRVVRSGRITLYMGASSYNNQEMIEVGADPRHCLTLAPFHLTEDFADAGRNEDLIQQRKEEECFQVLFVGRMMLHKGQHLLIDVIDQYLAMFQDEGIRLTLVGRIENESYGKNLQNAINERRLSSYVKVRTDVDYRDLHSYYLSSDAFICMSQHEGFGVPILEAQYHALPIVALDRTAISETAGSDQLLFKENSPSVFAAALYRLKNDKALCQQLVAKGAENYKRFQKDILAEKLRAAVETAFNFHKASASGSEELA